MSILPFENEHLAVLKRTLFHRTPPGGNAATGRWQCCHWAVAMLPLGGVRWKNLHDEMNRPTFKHDNKIGVGALANSKTGERGRWCLQ